MICESNKETFNFVIPRVLQYLKLTVFINKY